MCLVKQFSRMQAVISIAVILVVVLAAALAFVLCRRGSGHGRGFLGVVKVETPCFCLSSLGPLCCVWFSGVWAGSGPHHNIVLWTPPGGCKTALCGPLIWG